MGKGLKADREQLTLLRYTTVWNIYYLLSESEFITGKFQTVEGRVLRFPCNDRTDEVNKLLVIWPFNYGPNNNNNNNNNNK